MADGVAEGAAGLLASVAVAGLADVALGVVGVGVTETVAVEVAVAVTVAVAVAVAVAVTVAVVGVGAGADVVAGVVSDGVLLRLGEKFGRGPELDVDGVGEGEVTDAVGSTMLGPIGSERDGSTGPPPEAPQAASDPASSSADEMTATRMLCPRPGSPEQRTLKLELPSQICQQAGKAIRA